LVRILFEIRLFSNVAKVTPCFSFLNSVSKFRGRTTFWAISQTGSRTPILQMRIANLNR
jgi:hypothetical protein